MSEVTANFTPIENLRILNGRRASRVEPVLARRNARMGVTRVETRQRSKEQLRIK